MQRSAEEGDMAADRLAAGESGDGLVTDGLKDGSGQILLRRSLVDQRLDVRLGKDAAAGRDRVDRLIMARVLVESRGVGLQKVRHLVNEGSGAAGTDTVHALLDIAVLKIDDFRVLAAQLDGHIRLRTEGLDRRGDGYHLLDEGDAQILRERQTAGPGDGRGHLHIARPVIGLPDQLRRRSLNFRKMTLIIRKQDLSALVHKRDLHCRRTDIDTKCIAVFCHAAPLTA